MANAVEVIFVKKILFQYQDLGYKAFHEKLIPNIAPENVIGVRIPVLRKLARDLSASEKADRFIKELPHRYYEENNLHAFLIERISDFDKCITAVERFLPYVDNWATCDSMRPKCFKRNTDKLFPYAEKWLKSKHTYTVRYGVEMLMAYYLDESFDKRYPEMVASVKSDEYYINMMIAWYFATALAKRWDEVIEYLTKNRLDVWVHNKTIQKARESYRITNEQKEYLKNLKR